MAEGAPGSAAVGSAKKSGQGSTFVLLLGVLVVLFVMFDPTLRALMATWVGYGLNPIFVNTGVPIFWTLFVIGSFMVLANTVVRHFLTDWVGMARVQEVMRAYQKEFSEARKANNTYKLKRLTDMNPEVMKMQADMSTGQLKPMILTMLIVLPVFGWLFHVVDFTGGCDTVLEVPWAAPGSWCADNGTDWVGFIPRWIAIYSLLSIPIGQVVQKALKLWEYRHVDLDADGVPAGKSA